MLTINDGKLTTELEIISKDVSLPEHTHGGVRAGQADTEKPNT